MKEFQLVFRLSNKNMYYIDTKGNLVQIKEIANIDATIEDIHNNGKLYTYRGMRSVTEKIWNKKIFKEIFDSYDVTVKASYATKQFRNDFSLRYFLMEK